MGRLNNTLDRYDTLPPSGIISAPAVIFYCLIALITFFSPQLGSDHLALTLIAVMVALVSLGLRYQMGKDCIGPLLFAFLVGLASLTWQEKPPTVLPPSLEGEVLSMSGVIQDRQDRPDSIRLYLEQVNILPGQMQLQEPYVIANRVQITLYTQPSLEILPGDKIGFRAKLRSIRSLRNPGGFDYARYQRQRGITLSGYSKEDVAIIEPAFELSWNRYRQILSFWIMRVLPEEQQGLVEALMVGKRGLLNQELMEQLIVSGTIHLVAISGLHLGIAAGWSFYLIRWLLVLVIPLSRRWDMKRIAAALAMLPTIGYANLAGWSMPTQRATIMVCLFLLAVAVGRARDIWRVLAIAAIIVLIHQPGQLFSAGFQLSFLCVLALLYSIPLAQRTEKYHRYIKAVLGFVLASVMIMLVTSPVALYHFHRFSPYGLLANLFAIPFVSLLTIPLGLMAMLTHEISPFLGDQLLLAMGYMVDIFHVVIAWVSQLPGAWQRLPGPSLLGLALCMASWAMAGLLGMAGKRGWSIALFILSFPLLQWPGDRPPQDQLHLTALDVGQAQSVVVYSPDDGWSVYDAGGWSSARFNVGEAIISPYLWHHGVDHIKRLVISHPQRDHMAGAEQLLRNFQVDTLWVGYVSEKEKNQKTYRQLINRANKRGIPIRRIDQHFQVKQGDTTISVLPPITLSQNRNSNARSLVVEIGFGEQRFLIPGDATKRTEHWLLRQKVIHPLTALLAPHHGSKTSSSPPFVYATHPQHIIFSVGYKNRYRHPHPQVLKRWQDSGSQIWRTDLQGAVMIQSDGRKDVQITVAEPPAISPLQHLWSWF